VFVIPLLLACSNGSTPAPDKAPDKAPDPWQGVPLARDHWPSWDDGSLRHLEGVETLGDGRRRAWRVAMPVLQPGADGEAEVDVASGRLVARMVPAEGPAQSWEIDLFTDPERIAGTPLHLSPSQGDVVGMVEPGHVRAVLDLGHGAWGFTCRGADADLDPAGWCLSVIARTWVEVWTGPESGGAG